MEIFSKINKRGAPLIRIPKVVEYVIQNTSLKMLKIHSQSLSRAPPRGACTPGWEPLG